MKRTITFTLLIISAFLLVNCTKKILVVDNSDFLSAECSKNIEYPKYLQSVYQKISYYWELPDKDWKENIFAVVIVQVSQEGNVGKVYFENQSSSQEFNLYVERVLNKSNPLPVYPLQGNSKCIEFALKFTP